MDFSREILFPKITANKPSMDGSEVTNLVSKKLSSENLGFVCEGFVRTPVDIRIEFPLPIDIARIELNTEVGLRRSKGITILASCHSGSNCKKSDLALQSNDTENYICLGKWFMEKQSKVILRNYHYGHYLSFPIPETEKSSDNYEGAIKHPSYCSLAQINALIVRILAVTPFGPPVLKSIQIWGQPSINADLLLRRRLIRNWLNFISEKPSRPTTAQQPDNYDRSNTITGRDITKFCSEDATPENMPQEFLDPLTFEVMTIPILLPSGNSVDLCSIEKFTAIEALWGRLPSDPFTGVTFREGYKPEPNVTLKARIDRFLLLNKSEEVKGLGRTVGSVIDREGLHPPSSSKRCKFETVNELHSESMDSVTITNESNATYSEKGISSYLALDEMGQKPSPSSTKVEKPLLPLKSQLLSHRLIHTLGNAVSLTSTNRSSKPKPKLEAAIGMHSSRDADSRCLKDSKFSVDSLIEGSLACHCGLKDNLYQFGCGHYVCRYCLDTHSNSPTLQCKVCLKFSERSQINRIHQSSVFKR